jgi:hypothetical protein
MEVEAAPSLTKFNVKFKDAVKKIGKPKKQNKLRLKGLHWTNLLERRKAHIKFLTLWIQLGSLSPTIMKIMRSACPETHHVN